MSISDEEFIEQYNDVRRNPTLNDVAKRLNLAVKTVKNRAGLMRRTNLGDGLISRRGSQKTESEPHPFLDVEEIDHYCEDINELVDRAIRHNERYQKYHAQRELVTIKVKEEGPIAVAGIPDPHLNNPGTMLRKAWEDAQVIHDTPGLYCVGIGDWLDNFIIGRLERERRGDIMSHDDAVRLQEHYIVTIMHKLVAAIGGNHNDWPAMLGGTDLLAKLFNEYSLSSIYDPDQVRVKLVCPNKREFVHLARHKYRGHSKYNVVHGILVWMLEHWQGEDVLWGGHIHTSGMCVLQKPLPTGELKNVYGVQLASYKKIDRYALKHGFHENTPFVTPVVIHDPESGKTCFEEDIDEGIDRLKYMRKRFEEGKSSAVYTS